MIQNLAHLWHASMDSTDWKKIEVLMKGNRFHPLCDEGTWGKNTLNEGDNKVWEPAEPFDWNLEITKGDRTFGSSEHAYLMYFDADKKQPGLSKDVAALVEDLEAVNNFTIRM